MAKAKQNKKTTKGEIEIVHQPDNALFFREAWADGEHEGEKFDVTRDASASAIHFQYKGRFYTVTLKSIVDAFLTAATED